MQVSVVISTWERCESLRRTLESLRSLAVPASQRWELIVVNNGSRDRTDEVVADYQESLPLRRIVEPEIGLSKARNTAVRAAVGDLVLFTDDDVRIDPSWIGAYLAAAHRWPEAGYFGGEIHPQFAGDVPGWVKRHQSLLSDMLCLRDLGPVGRWFQPGEFPYGPNMAIRREVLALAAFDERVGRKGYEQVRGSEGSLFLSLQRQGVSGVWVPEAKVYHHVPGCRADFRYLWKYHQGSGRTEVRLAKLNGLPLQPRWRLLMTGMKALARTAVRPTHWPKQVATLALVSGKLTELAGAQVRPENLAAVKPRAGTAFADARSRKREP